MLPSMRTTTLVAALAALPAAACIPALPPPSHYAPMSPNAALDGNATEVVASVTYFPNLAFTHSRSLEGLPALVFDAQAQLGLTFGSVSPGLWVRSRGGETTGGHVGARLGVVGGTGDFLGFLPYQMPFAGPTLHLQYASGWGGKRLGGVAVTLGAEGAAPLFPEAIEIDDDDVDDDVDVTAIPVYVVYGSLDLRLDIPAGDKVAIVLGGGVDVAMWGYFLPTGTLGVRF